MSFKDSAIDITQAMYLRCEAMAYLTAPPVMPEMKLSRKKL
jgi:hypothetical protein